MIDSILATVDGLLARTALPNLHVALVHFPLALLVTALGFDLACLFARKYVWLDRAAAALYLLGTLGAGAAYLSGELAVDQLPAISGVAQATLAEHEDLALMTLIAFAAVTALRVLVSWLARDDRRIHLGFFRLLALVAAMAAQSLLFMTADHGGALVYRHGVGVGLDEPQIPADELEP